MRHKIGDSILINEYIVRIIDLKEDILSGIVEGIEQEESENNKIKLYHAYLKSDKMEFVVQKSIELGINDIIPFLSKNCVVKLNEKDKLKKIDRLNKISLEASKQCGRSDIVQIDGILNISDSKFREELVSNTFNILAYENSSMSLKETLRDIQKQNVSVGVIIGPEGGFDKSEAEFAASMGAKAVSLGKRILRTETAGFAALAMIMYELDK